MMFDMHFQAQADMRFAWCYDKLVDAYEEVKLDHKRETYKCTRCPDRHDVTLVVPKHERYKVPAWFRHRCSKIDLEQRCNGVGHGGGGGESDTHWHAKYLLQSRKGRYSFEVEYCTGCHQLGTIKPAENSDSVHVSIEETVGPYRIDAVLHNVIPASIKSASEVQSNTKTAMEVFNSNPVPIEKREYLYEQGFDFAEFDASDVIKKLENLPQDAPVIKLQNLHIRRRFCTPECERKFKAEQTRIKNEEEKIRKAKEEKKNQSFQLVMSARHKIRERKEDAKSKNKARGFCEAEQKSERNNSSVRSKEEYQPYVNGQMFKCPECDKWIKKQFCEPIYKEQSGKEWFNDAAYRPYYQQYVLTCSRCSIECESCHETQPLSHALRYGLCYECNNGCFF